MKRREGDSGEAQTRLSREGEKEMKMLIILRPAKKKKKKEEKEKKRKPLVDSVPFLV